MKGMIFVCLVVVAAVAFARPDEKYTDKYDDIDMAETLSNERLRKPYVLCWVDQGKCAPDAKELKIHIKEALEDGCAKCSEKQIEGVKKAIGYLIKNHPDEWKLLTDKYDPDNKYSQKYENELKGLQA